jgi:DNA helicase HerA-like ATPase
MDPLLIAKGDSEVRLLPQMANRHGLIAGATGTGKTVTLQVLAEQFSALGVPLFMADIKGDFTGISQPGGQNPKVKERIEQLQLGDYAFTGYPVTLWDVFGEQGHPIRTTISELGPLLLSRLLQLNDTQSGVLSLIFRVADENGLLLLDLKDLRSMAQFVGERASEFTTRYGNISPASIGAIQRALLRIESEGADRFFGEPALNLDDFIQTDASGRGVINILAADKLMAAPKVYATMLLWLLSELFERLPEGGDLPKPKLVFFFDEAHLLFNDIPSALLEKIEQVVRLVRSKGVGVYFVTQNPRDVPDNILGQLGNRVQHALRAFTPRDQKAIQAAAETFRPNPKLNTTQVLTELAVGEALVSVLDDKGQPTVVERAFVVPPHSQIGPITPDQRRQLLQSSTVAGIYEKSVDRESAYEKLAAAAQETAQQQPDRAPPGSTQQAEPQGKGLLEQVFGGVIGGMSGQRTRRSDSVVESLTKSVMRSVGSQVGREIVRGVLGSIFGGTRRRR